MNKKIFKQIQKYGKENGFEITKEFLVQKLFEEVGELSQAILIDDKKCRKEKFISKEKSKYLIEREIGDVIGLTICISEFLGINYKKATEEKWIKNIN